MKKSLLLVVGLLVACWAEATPVPAVVPQPLKMEVGDTPAFELTETFVIVSAEDFRAEAQFAADELNRATGYDLRVIPDRAKMATPRAIRFVKVDGLPAEGYRLTTDLRGARIEASTPAGAFYGYQTLRQLLPVEIYSDEVVTDIAWEVPTVTIEDAPRLPWRGLHFDDCRHFIGADGFKAMVDAMAIHKLNTLHWHLTDDQGWRIEIKRYPEIVAKGAVRDESPVMWDRWKGDGTPYGPYYYTQDEVRELVAYAAARHITVVPEIEMPGHALGILSAYPELGCTGGPYKPWCRWGVSPEIACAGNDKTLEVFEGILEEVLTLFPSKYIHCGGDEAPKDRWNTCEKCQERIEDEGLRDANHLQTWFMQHFASYLEARGRHMIGWDEILEGGLPKGAAVMSWRGAAGGIAAAKMGHQVVMSPNSHAYLDYGQGLEYDPYEYIGSTVTLQKTYALNPTEGIPEAMAHYVIGVQGNLWSEYIWTANDQQWKAWPRAAAIAEVGWTPQALRDWASFRKRMETDRERLLTLGINVAPLERVAPFTMWRSGQIPTTWTYMEWDVTDLMATPGTYSFLFQYTYGAARLDIGKVELFIGASGWTADIHPGRTGMEHVDNVYTLTLPSIPEGATLKLRAEVRADGSDDSNGLIFFKKH